MLRMEWTLTCKTCGTKVISDKYDTAHKEMAEHRRKCKKEPGFWRWNTNYKVLADGTDVTEDFDKLVEELRSAGYIYYEDELPDVCADMHY